MRGDDSARATHSDDRGGDIASLNKTCPRSSKPTTRCDLAHDNWIASTAAAIMLLQRISAAAAGADSPTRVMQRSGLDETFSSFKGAIVRCTSGPNSARSFDT